MHLPGKKKKSCRKWAELSTEQNTIIGLRGRLENCDLSVELFKSAKDDNGHKYICRVCQLRPHEEERLSHKASPAEELWFQVWLLLAERVVQLAFLKNLSATEQRLKELKNLVDEPF